MTEALLPLIKTQSLLQPLESEITDHVRITVKESFLASCELLRGGLNLWPLAKQEDEYLTKVIQTLDRDPHIRMKNIKLAS